jgi:hypothetical protein
MHVLFVSDTWGLIGGTERYAAVVVPELEARGHRVTVLCREDRDGGASPVAARVVERPELAGHTLARWQRRALRTGSSPRVLVPARSFPRLIPSVGPARAA